MATFKLIPSTWKEINDSEIDRIFESILREANDLGYLPDVHYELYRFKSTQYWGMCRTTFSSEESVIGLNECILKSEEVLYKVIVHELAHACVPKEHHSARWERIGNEIGKRFGVTVKRCDDYSDLGCTLEERKTAYKWVCECPHCGMRYERQKKTAIITNAKNYSCGRCGWHGLVGKAI